MGEVTLRRRFTAELSVKVEDLVASARMRFKILAGLAFIECSGLGWLIDWGRSGETELGIFAVIGGVTGLMILLLILDWGRKLDHRPRAMNLIKARNGAIILHGLLPLGPLVAWGLFATLRHPTLVSYAVSNHPDAGQLDDEEVLATVRVRSAYITLRRAGFFFTVVAAIAAFAGSGTPEGEMDAEARLRFFMAAIAIGIYALGHLVNGFVGVGLLKEMTARRVKTVRKFSPLIWGLLPFGTYAAWAARRVDLDGLPSGDPAPPEEAAERDANERDDDADERADGLDGEGESGES